MRYASSSRPRTPRPGRFSPNTATCWTSWPASCWRKKPCTAPNWRRSSPTSKSGHGSPCSTTSVAASRRTSRRSRHLASWPSSAASRGRKPAPEPAFKAAIAAASRDAAQAEADRATNGANGSHGEGRGVAGAAPNHTTQPDYGAPAGWHAPGWPPPQQAQQPPGYWYPPPSPPPPPAHWAPPPHNYGGQPYPPYPPYPPPGAPAPEAGQAVEPPGGDPSPSNPPTHG